MDANGLRFWMLADDRDWAPDAHVEYDLGRRALRLRSERGSAPEASRTAAARERARSALEVVPGARDAFGARAWWDPGVRQVLAQGFDAPPVAVYQPPADESPTDLAVGHDGVLYLAVGGAVVLRDLRDRWDDVVLRSPGISAWRLAPDPEGGVWVLDRVRQQLAHVHGLPFPRRPGAGYAVTTVRPCPENRHPPRLEPLPDVRWAGEAVAIATAPTGRLAVLAWQPADDAVVHLSVAGGTLARHIRLRDARSPFSVAWTADDALAVLVPGLPREALVYELDGDGATAADGVVEAAAVGRVHPMRGPAAQVGPERGEPFLHGPTLPPHYRAPGGSAPLVPLSAPTYAVAGGTQPRDDRPFESHDSDTVWHRLYVEASIPIGCGVRVWLAAGDAAPDPGSPDWHEHRFGARYSVDGQIPIGAWVPFASEVPFHPGLLRCQREPGRAGLFTALVQRSNRMVRTLRGRRLWVRVALEGDGRSTPEVAAVRVHASRHSYAESYLPELYREQEFGVDAERVLAPGEWPRSTPADFLGRLLANFEGVLTPIADRVDGAYLLTDPATAPAEALAWLGGWVGVAFEPAYPAERRRRLIAETPRLYRERGTLAALVRALDVATGDRCSRGEIVVVENYRLRRTFATILGADLADEADPLLGGLVFSGNSYVGDTLVLGEEQRKEFLALFDARLPSTPDERAAVAAFFDRLAHRVTVLVHETVDEDELGLVRRVVELEKPAHVAATVVRAPHPFIVGAASLVGVDTFLGAPTAPGPVVLDRSGVGERDVLARPASLDPRLTLGGGRAPVRAGERPIADAGPDSVVRPGEPITFDGGGSRAAPGRRIAGYSWTLLR